MITGSGPSLSSGPPLAQTAPDVHALLVAVTTEGARAVGGDCAFLCLEVEDGTRLRCEVSVGGLLAGHPVAPEDCAAAAVWRARRALEVPDYDAWPDREPGIPHGLVAGVLGVPLRVDGRVMGALVTARARGRPAFEDGSLELLGRLADLGAIALQNARLLEEERAARERAERLGLEARASEQRYRDLVEQTLAIVCTHDLAGVVTSVNPAACMALGRTEAELMGRRLDALLEDPADPNYPAYLERVARDGRATGMMHVRTAAGEVRYWRYHNVVRPAASGAPQVIAFAQDVTDVVLSRRVLQESEARLRDLAENTDVVMFVRRVQPPQILYVSPAYERIFGRAPDGVSLDPESLFADVHPGDRDRVTAGYRRAPEEPFNETYRILRPDGGQRWVRTRTFPVRDAHGEAVRVVGICEDVTAAQEAVSMRADLTRMLVHDLKSPIAGVASCLDLLAEGGSGEAERREMLRLSRRSADRVLALVNGLLEIDRLEQGALPLQRARVEVPALLEAAIEPVLAAALTKDVALEVVAPPGLPALRVDADLLTRALGNVLSNAVRFAPQGGRVRLAAEPAADAVVLSVGDSGPGFEPELATRLFQRFASGRRSGSGTGLGLAFCRLVVEAHGGGVRAQAAPGGGALVSLSLPVGDAAPSR